MSSQSVDSVKQHKRMIIDRYSKSDNIKGLTQVLTTLVSLAFLWWVAIVSVATSRWLTALAMLLISLFTLRVFALMHECGHRSLFLSPSLNRAAGFVLGVVAGMPQYVWSQHHNYHHANNGNWEKYRGPYATRSVDEFAGMTSMQRRIYMSKCSIAAAPLAGFIYLIFNPRFTWLKGSMDLVIHIAKSKIARRDVSMREHASSYTTRYWKSPQEYWHMFWNNVVLLSAWALMCSAVGATAFFSIYLITVSIAGGAGIVLFTVQHNFPHAYASDTQSWDYDTAALEGTSVLDLPYWLNWFTANISYHHIHHISASIPNYCLVECHNEYQHLFVDVRRLKLSQIYDAMQYILWDRRAQRIISVPEYRQQIPRCT